LSCGAQFLRRHHIEIERSPHEETHYGYAVKGLYECEKLEVVDKSAKKPTQSTDDNTDPE
jgi:hypothetical protein